MHFFSHTSKVLTISSTSLEKFSSVTLFNMYFSFINLVFFCLFFFHLLCIVMSLLYILVIASATEQVNRLWGVCVCVWVCARAHACVHVHAQLCPTLCSPMDCSPPDSSVHRISQARILDWVAISYTGVGIFPTQGLNLCPLHPIVRRILYH